MDARTFAPAEGGAIIDYARDIHEILRVNRIDIYGGDAVKSEYFPRGIGIEHVSPTLIDLQPDTRFDEAIRAARTRIGGTVVCNVWHLAACAAKMIDGIKVKRIVALGCEAEISGCAQYPVVGINGKQLYLGMVRDSYSTLPTCRGLAVQVMVR